MGTPQRARILILHSIKMRSVTSSALALALALAVGGASAQVEVGGWEECPTPYEMGFGGDKIGYIIANTYDQAGQSPKCEAVPGQNGPDGAVDPNSFDTQNIVAIDSLKTCTTHLEPAVGALRQSHTKR